MRICGVIAEYDPFHHGHRHQFEQAKEHSQAELMVCVLGTAFSQRGEAMLFSTHQRARMAMDQGYDLVLGMPISFSCAQANRFARGGVGILHQLGFVSHLSFGSEQNELSLLQAAALALHQEGEVFSKALRSGLDAGLSFAAAQGRALAEETGLDASLLAQPNFILGLCYLRELLRLNSPMIPVPIKRDSPYRGGKGQLASASRVRKMLMAGDAKGVQTACPDTTLAAISEAAMHLPSALDKALLAKLLVMKREDLARGPELSEGLEDRILRLARECSSREELIQKISSKRYPRARVSRALLHALLGIEEGPFWPRHARVLGITQKAAALLGQVDPKRLDLVSRPARSSSKEVLQDMKAEELWCLGAGLPAQAAYQLKVLSKSKQA